MSLKKYTFYLLILALLSKSIYGAVGGEVIEAPKAGEGSEIFDPFKESAHPGFDVPPAEKSPEETEQPGSSAIDTSSRTGKDRENQGDETGEETTTLPTIRSTTTNLMTPGKINVSRGAIGAILDTIKSLFKQLGIGTLKTALTPLNTTLEKIAELPEGTTLSASDLKTVQDQLADVTHVLNSSPKTNFSEALRTQLNYLTGTLYGKGVTIEDIAPAEQHFKNAKEAVEWISNPLEKIKSLFEGGQGDATREFGAEEEGLSTFAQTEESLVLSEEKATPKLDLSKIEDEFLHSADSKQITIALQGAVEKLEPGSSTIGSHLAFNEDPRKIITDVNYAVDVLDRYLTATQDATPETRILQTQEAYATLVIARTLFSALASTVLDDQLHTQLLSVLNKAKANYVETEALAKNLKIPQIQH